MPHVGEHCVKNQLIPTTTAGEEAFLPAQRYASAGLCDSDVSVRLSVCPSVRLSVCLSVTRRYCA